MCCFFGVHSLLDFNFEGDTEQVFLCALGQFDIWLFYTICLFVYYKTAEQQEEIGALYDTLEEQKGEILRLHDMLGRLTGGPQGKDY